MNERTNATTLKGLDVLVEERRAYSFESQRALCALAYACTRARVCVCVHARACIVDTEPRLWRGRAPSRALSVRVPRASRKPSCVRLRPAIRGPRVEYSLSLAGSYNVMKVARATREEICRILKGTLLLYLPRNIHEILKSRWL